MVILKYSVNKRSKRILRKLLNDSKRCKLASLGCMRILSFKEAMLKQVKAKTGYTTAAGNIIFLCDIIKVVKMYGDERPPFQIDLKPGHSCTIDTHLSNKVHVNWDDLDGFNKFIEKNKITVLERAE